MAICVLSCSVVSVCDPMDCSPPVSSAMVILQVGILEWVVMPPSRGSSQPRVRTQVSRIAGGFFTIWAPREAPSLSTLGWTGPDGNPVGQVAREVTVPLRLQVIHVTSICWGPRPPDPQFNLTCKQCGQILILPKTLLEMRPPGCVVRSSQRTTYTFAPSQPSVSAGSLRVN